MNKTVDVKKGVEVERTSYAVIVGNPKRRGDNMDENLKIYRHIVSHVLELEPIKDKEDPILGLGYKMCCVFTRTPGDYEKKLKEHGVDGKLVEVDLQKGWKNEFAEQKKIMEPLYEEKENE